jgi:hypothetical protein
MAFTRSPSSATYATTRRLSAPRNGRMTCRCPYSGRAWCAPCAGSSAPMHGRTGWSAEARTGHLPHFEHVAQLLRGSFGIKPKNSADNIVGSDLIG